MSVRQKPLEGCKQREWCIFYVYRTLSQVLPFKAPSGTEPHAVSPAILKAEGRGLQFYSYPRQFSKIPLKKRGGEGREEDGGGGSKGNPMYYVED